jgi:hypothetical protein
MPTTRASPCGPRDQRQRGSGSTTLRQDASRHRLFGLSRVMLNPRPPIFSICVNAVALATLGVASRYHFRSTETRWQIAGFVAAAGLAETGWTAAGFRPSWLRFAIGAGAAALAITATKFHVEPQALHADTARAAHIVRASARKALR